MPRIEIEFEFDIVLCFGICLTPYAVFSTRIYLQHIAQPVESDRPINIVFARASVRSMPRNYVRFKFLRYIIMRYVRRCIEF